MKRTFVIVFIMFFPPILSSFALAWCIEKFRETISPYYLFIIPILYSFPIFLGLLLTFAIFTYYYIKGIKNIKLNFIIIYKLIALIIFISIIIYLIPILFFPYNSIEIDVFLLKLIFIHYMIISIFNILILIIFMIILPYYFILKDYSILKLLLNIKIYLHRKIRYIFMGLIMSFIVEVALANIASIYPLVDSIYIVSMPRISHPELMKTIQSLNYTIYDILSLIATVFVLMFFYSKYINNIIEKNNQI